ncbi:MAG: ribonuclease E/G [Phycisphaerae bacterium]
MDKPLPGLSDFGAGILESEPAPEARPTDKTAVRAPSAAAGEEEATDTASQPSPSAESTTPTPQDSDGQKTGRSRSARRRRSRTRRLAEEAEVIAAIERSDSGSRAADTGEDADTAPQQQKKLRRGSRRRSRSNAAGEPGDRTEGRTARSRSARASTDAAPADLIDFDAVEEREHTAETEATESKRSTTTAPRKRVSSSAEPASSAKSEYQEMLINVAEAEECRIAILRDHRLDELRIERAASSSNVGNIYKGRVTNVESSIQAAFIDFGLPAHGFLHISDLHPQYFPDSKGEPELVGKKTPRRQRPPIQSCLKRGQEVIVQVIKEGIGTKGPTLTSYLSIPGRFLVMMPGMEQLGVSRKIEDEEKRRKMRDVLSQLSLPKDMGFIARTAGVNRTKRDLQRDLNFLSRLWRKVVQRIKTEPSPAEIYKESDLVIRTIRDVYDASLKRIIVDSPAVADRVREFLAIASPRAQDVVGVYEGPEPMFHKYGIEAEIERLHSRHVPLPCGGSIIIEQTEAMVAIDVNSGRFRVPENAEETAFRVNLEAVDEIARQLRLRDLGGLIVCDLIDMTQERHRRTIERRLSEALRKHKERAKVLRISKFGLLELTRQRQRPSLSRSMFRECPHCGGHGHVKAAESVALDVMRQLRLASQREGVACIDLRVSTAVADDLLNRKRHQLVEIERVRGLTIRVQGDPAAAIDAVTLSCSDLRGREVPPLGAPRRTANSTRQDSSRRSRGTGRRRKRAPRAG